MLPILVKHDLVLEVAPYIWITWPALDRSWCCQIVRTMITLLIAPTTRMLVCDVIVSTHYKQAVLGAHTSDNTWCKVNYC